MGHHLVWNHISLPFTRRTKWNLRPCPPQSLFVTGGHVIRRTVQFFMIWYHYLRRCIVLGNVKRVQPQAALAVDSGQRGGALVLKPSTVEAPCLDGKKTCQICLNPVKFYRTSLNHLKHPEVSCSLDHGESPFYIPRKKQQQLDFLLGGSSHES